MSGRVLLTALGALVVLAVYLDAFLTVFDAGGRAGPLTRGLGRATWGFFRRTAPLVRAGRRDAWLRRAAPVLVVLTLLAWGLLLIVGFACVYRPWIESFLVSPGHLRGPWPGALYYSGITATTVGQGDLVADATALRMATVLEAFSGFALVTVAVSYLLNVYGQLLVVRALASRIAAFVPEGGMGAWDPGRADVVDALAGWAEGVTAQLYHVREAQFQYPILRYFRPGDPRRSLTVQLGALVALRRRVAEAETPGAVRDNPAIRALAETVARYLDDVDTIFLPASVPSSGEGDRVERTYGRLLRYMGYEAGR